MPNFTAKLVVNAIVESDHLSANEVQTALNDRLQLVLGASFIPEGMDAKLMSIRFDTAIEASNEASMVAILPVSATVCSDDTKVCAGFDCSKWFAQASDDEIMTLGCGAEWGASDIADDIAHFYLHSNPEVATVFHYLGQRADARKLCSYECHIDPVTALAWLKVNRPHLYRLLRDEE